MRSSETKTVTGIRKLVDLRELVAHLADWPDDATVTLKEAKTYDARDREEASVTIMRTAVMGEQ